MQVLIRTLLGTWESGLLMTMALKPCEILIAQDISSQNKLHLCSVKGDNANHLSSGKATVPLSIASINMLSLEYLPIKSL